MCVITDRVTMSQNITSKV